MDTRLDAALGGSTVTSRSLGDHSHHLAWIFHGPKVGRNVREVDSAFSLLLRFGWARNHHIAVSVPLVFNDSHGAGKSIHNNGLASVFVFEKWPLVKKIECLPAAAGRIKEANAALRIEIDWSPVVR